MAEIDAQGLPEKTDTNGMSRGDQEKFDQGDSGNRYLAEMQKADFKRPLEAEEDNKEQQLADVGNKLGIDNPDTTTGKGEPQKAQNKDSKIKGPDESSSPNAPNSKGGNSANSLPEGNSDPSVDLKDEGNLLGQNDNHVSQLRGEANTNETNSANGNCAAAALVSMGRNVGVLDSSGGGDSAASQINQARNAANPGSGAYDPITFGQTLKGAQAMGMDAHGLRANSANPLKSVDDELNKGNMLMAAVNPNAYSNGAHFDKHMVNILNKNEEGMYRISDPLMQRESKITGQQLSNAMKGFSDPNDRFKMISIKGAPGEEKIGSPGDRNSDLSDRLPGSSGDKGDNDNSTNNEIRRKKPPGIRDFNMNETKPDKDIAQKNNNQSNEDPRRNWEEMKKINAMLNPAYA